MSGGLRWTDEMFQSYQLKSAKPKPPESVPRKMAARSPLPSPVVGDRGEPPVVVASPLIDSSCRFIDTEIEIKTPAQYRHEQKHPLRGMCAAAGLPIPSTEFQFHPLRKWMFDYAWPLLLVAVECEGGIWRRGGGAHSHPLNIERDIEKYNAAALLGFRILRYAPEDLKKAIADLRVMFSGE